MICVQCQRDYCYHLTAQGMKHRWCSHHKTPPGYKGILVDRQLPITYKTKSNLRQLFSELVQVWADNESMSRKQMRKLAEEFFKLGRAYGSGDWIIEEDNGEITLKQAEPGLKEDDGMKDLAKRLEKI